LAAAAAGSPRRPLPQRHCSAAYLRAPGDRVSERLEPTDGNRLVSASEVARIARVAPSAVSNWRKRYPDFPSPAGTAASGGHLFRLAEIELWLASHQPERRRPRGSTNVAQQLWAVI